MKKITISLLLVLIFNACEKDSKKNPVKPSKKKQIVDSKSETKEDKQVVINEKEIVEEVETSIIRQINTDKFDFNNFKGFYVGAFKAVNYKEHKKPSYSNRINISLDSVNEQNKILYGHSVVAGNIRPFKGNYKFDLKKYTIKAEVVEPGDDKYDGVFTFTCNPKGLVKYDSEYELIGTWIANDKNLAVSKRKFKLQYKVFKYNKNQELLDDQDGPFMGDLHNKYGDVDYKDEVNNEMFSEDILKFNASNIKLTFKDVENLHKGDLEIIRNAIYARHGYSFKNRRMRYFFDDNIDWYIPVTKDVRKDLTPLEKDNINLLKRYEKHAKKYYDYFGR
jgi:hypothetical protein